MADVLEHRPRENALDSRQAGKRSKRFSSAACAQSGRVVGSSQALRPGCMGSEMSEQARESSWKSLAFYVMLFGAVAGYVAIEFGSPGDDSVEWENSSPHWPDLATDEANSVYEQTVEFARRRPNGELVRVSWPDTGEPPWLRLRAMKSGLWTVDGVAGYLGPDGAKTFHLHGEFLRGTGECVYMELGGDVAISRKPRRY